MFSAFVERLPWLWLSAVILGGAFLELLWLRVVVMRANDLDFDPERCAKRKPPVNLDKALRRRESWTRLGFPLFVICAALFAAQAVYLNFFTYMAIAFCWFLTAPIRKMWGIAIGRRVYTQRNNEPPHTSYWHDVGYYYSWGFELPERPDNREPWFIGKYRWLNKFQKLWYVLQIWRAWGVFAQAAAGLLWPISSAIAIFYHIDMVEERSYHRPWWRFNRDESRRPKKPQVIEATD